jgi:hypothetical protein
MRMARCARESGPSKPSQMSKEMAPHSSGARLRSLNTLMRFRSTRALPMHSRQGAAVKEQPSRNSRHGHGSFQKVTKARNNSHGHVSFTTVTKVHRVAPFDSVCGSGISCRSTTACHIALTPAPTSPLHSMPQHEGSTNEIMHTAHCPRTTLRCS